MTQEKCYEQGNVLRFYSLNVSSLGLGITRYLAIRNYHYILPMIMIISRYSDSAIIDILQEISSKIQNKICVTEEIQKLLTALNVLSYKTLYV